MVGAHSDVKRKTDGEYGAITLKERGERQNDINGEEKKVGEDSVIWRDFILGFN